MSKIKITAKKTTEIPRRFCWTILDIAPEYIEEIIIATKEHEGFNDKDGLIKIEIIDETDGLIFIKYTNSIVYVNEVLGYRNGHI